MVVVIIHESGEFLLQFPRKVIVLKFDDILHRSIIAFDLPLGHSMIRGSLFMSHVLIYQKVFQLSQNITRPIIA